MTTTTPSDTAPPTGRDTYPAWKTVLEAEFRNFNITSVITGDPFPSRLCREDVGASYKRTNKSFITNRLLT